MTTMLLEAGVSCVLVGASDPPAADERRALGELAALVAAAAGRRRGPDGRARRRDERATRGVRRHRDTRRARSCSGPRRKRGDARPVRSPSCSSSWPCRPTTRGARSGPARWRWPRSSIGGSTSSRSASMPGRARRRRPGSRGGTPSLDLAVVPSAALAHRRSRRFGRRPGRPVVDLGRRPASPARSPARAAARARGPTRPATASRSGWPPPGQRWVASRNGPRNGTTGHRPT